MKTSDRIKLYLYQQKENKRYKKEQDIHLTKEEYLFLENGGDVEEMLKEREK